MGELNSLHPGLVLSFGIQVLTNPSILLGIICLIAALLLYLAAISRFDLSYVLPMMALSYVLSALFASLILHEQISPIRWLGTWIISGGVFLVALSERKLPPKVPKAPSWYLSSLFLLSFSLTSSLISSRIGLAVAGMVLADSIGDILLASGMKQVGEVNWVTLRTPLKLAHQVTTNSLIYLGIFCMTIAFFLYIALLSWVDLSFVMPMTALNYPLTALGTRYFLKENLSHSRLVGTGLTCIGVAFISSSVTTI